MHDAKQFSAKTRDPDRYPIWYWNRHVRMQLRIGTAEYLRLAGVKAGSRVLEFGCGNCPCEKITLATGATYEGADLPGNELADHDIDTAGRVPVADGTYDVVISSQVLEHVPDPAAHLAEARRLLRPGGRLILSTHGIWVYHPVPEDLWRWTHAGLVRTLEKGGFRTLEIDGLVGLLPGALQLMQDELRRRLPRWLQKSFTTLMQALVVLADKLHGRTSRRANAMIYIVLAE